MSKSVTSSDVARLAGVSQTTVSLILNNSPKNTFSFETRERVLKAAQQLNYQFHARKKKAENTAASRTLLVLIPTMMNEYYSNLISMVEAYAQPMHYRVFVCNTFRKPELEKYYLDTFAGSIAGGIIYTFLPGHPHLVEQISQTIPTVIIGEKHPDMTICSIELSNMTAGAMLADHLFEQGHRKFVFISTPLNQMSLARSQRLDGIRRQLELRGVQNGLDVLTDNSGSETDQPEDGMPYEYAIGRKLTARLLQQGTDATALIGVNDMTAIGILNELTERGFRVPKDFSVCGFDNIFSSKITTPGLTTIDHHLKLRCESAVDMIISRLEPGNAKQPFVSKIEFTPQLIVRGSTAPISGRRQKK